MTFHLFRHASHVLQNHRVLLSILFHQEFQKDQVHRHYQEVQDYLELFLRRFDCQLVREVLEVPTHQI